uniref:Uncharacterized protein LOC100176526 n=1 Tax=Phallusia mammillata TaxID=59560 RepID=A0A6F9DGJ4_9ASCI|nr:uncharacterized protein LOC100176526 [Phallusia mammillata]
MFCIRRSCFLFCFSCTFSVLSFHCFLLFFFFSSIFLIDFFNNATLSFTLTPFALETAFFHESFSTISSAISGSFCFISSIFSCTVVAFLMHISNFLRFFSFLFLFSLGWSLTPKSNLLKTSFPSFSIPFTSPLCFRGWVAFKVSVFGFVGKGIKLGLIFLCLLCIKLTLCFFCDTFNVFFLELGSFRFNFESSVNSGPNPSSPFVSSLNKIGFLAIGTSLATF